MSKHERKEDKPAGFPVGRAKKDPHAQDGSRKRPGHHAEDHPRNTTRKDDKPEGEK